MCTGPGLPVPDGSHKVAVTFHDAKTEGVDLWSEVHNVVPATRGVFHLLLGSKDPLPQDLFVSAPEIRIGVSVDNEPELPRTRMARAAWAFSAAGAASAETAKGLHCAGCVAKATGPRARPCASGRTALG